jgi:ABC-2 type transport system permease protein
VSLVRAELERFRSRGVLWLVTGLLLLAASGYVILAWSHTAPPSAADRIAAQAAYDRDAEWIADFNSGVDEHCRKLRDAGVKEPTCEPLELPAVESYLPVPPEFGETGPQAASGMGIAVMLAALAMGVSFVSAEFGSGAMATWLTFVPRRQRVLGSKTLAATLGVLPVALAAFAVAVGGVALVHLVRGLPVDDGAAWATVGRDVLPALPMVAAATVLGTALAFAMRHAAAVAGVVVWWLVAIEMTLPRVLPPAAPFTFGLNARAWLDGGAEYTLRECVPDPAVPGTELCSDVVHTVGALQGGAVVLAFVAVLVTVGALSFRWRDVA